MELLQLEYFVRVAQLGSVTRAAQELYVSQPALSATIARLEKDLGVQLFARSPNRIALTEPGKTFLDYASRALALLEQGHNAALRQEKEQQSTVRIASVLGVTRHVKKLYCSKHPDHEIELMMCSRRADVLRLLVKGRADFGLTLQPIPDERLRRQTVMRGRWCAAVPFESPIKHRITLAELSGLNLFCSNLGETESAVRSLFTTAGLPCNLLCLDDKEILFDAVTKNLGVVICLPMLYDQILGMDPHMDNIRFAVIEDATAPCEVSLATLAEAELSTPTRAVITATAEHFAQNHRLLQSMLATYA